jgi:hypothetical protein
VLPLFVVIVLLDEGWLCIVDELDVPYVVSDVPPFSLLQPTANMHANAISAINFFIFWSFLTLPPNCFGPTLSSIRGKPQKAPVFTL